LMSMASGDASAEKPFPGQPPDRSVLKAQQKADKLFKDEQYERAMLIYRRKLAPKGDKFAQYMVGYMHYSGRGVPEDAVRASSWYRLAAERGDVTFVKVRDVLMGLLNDEQRARSDTIFSEIRTEFGDVALLIRLINEDLAYLRDRRGAEPFFQQDMERVNFGQRVSNYQQTANNLGVRIDYLVELLGSDPTISDVEQKRVDRIEAEARREINAFEASVK
jgi:TPR repeat protein